jgi:hypothetical protein
VLPSPDDESAGGTGYLISRDRVLTAAHVVAESDHVAILFDLDDRVGELGRSKKTIRKPHGAKVRWRGEESCDIALLMLDEPVPFEVQPPRFAEASLASAARWESRGWAAAAEDEPLVRDSLIDLHGEAAAFLAGQKRCQLTIEAHLTEIDLWSGISGAAVFERDAPRRLLGVIAEALPSFENVLHACPIAGALRSESFRAALGSKIALERREQLTQDVERILSTPPRKAAEAIAGRRPDWLARFGEEGAVGLTDELLFTADVVDVLVELNHTHNQLWVTEQPPRATAATIAAVVARIAPLLVQAGWLHALPSQSGGALLRLPITTATIAELAVAGFEGRPSDWRPRGLEYPDGRSRLPLPQEMGFDVDGERAVHAYGEHLERSFLTSEDRGLLERRRRKPGGERSALDRTFALVDDELAYQAEHGDHPMRRYLLYDEIFARENAPFLGEIRQRLKSIHLVEMTGDDLLGERRISRPLRDLVARYAETDEPREERKVNL